MWYVMLLMAILILELQTNRGESTQQKKALSPADPNLAREKLLL